jgi:hypothetical protein
LSGKKGLRFGDDYVAGQETTEVRRGSLRGLSAQQKSVPCRTPRPHKDARRTTRGNSKDNSEHGQDTAEAEGAFEGAPAARCRAEIATGAGESQPARETELCRAYAARKRTTGGFPKGGTRYRQGKT